MFKSVPELLINGRSVELVYASHLNWPFGSLVARENNAQRPLRLSVLDSSFNPPTRAHLALANTHRPQFKDDHPELQGGGDYDAKLLLLSVKNADKKLKPGDASYSQRLDMMALLTRHVKPATPTATANVAIAITDEPTFAGKSNVLLAFLRQKISCLSEATSIPDIELTFLVGQDTLERLFSSHYYPSDAIMANALHKFLFPAPEGDNSRLVSANRGLTPITSSASDENNTTASRLAQHYISLGRLKTIDIGEEESTYSSSAVRNAIACISKDPQAKPTWKTFVTAEVADYITQQKLYADESMRTTTGFPALQS